MIKLSYLSLGLVMLASGYSYADTEYYEHRMISDSLSTSTMVSLTDDELEQTQGQALFNLSYLAPGQATNPYNSSNGNIGFYTLGIEAEVAINANIKNLQLGCGGVNGAGGCDVEIQNFSLGCIANSSGVCVSLPTNTTGTATNNPASHTTISSTVTDLAANQQQLKDFVLTNPFYQFAIRNPDNAATREVVGIRIGAANAEGPMSFNDIITFSGYLSGIANITMQGQTNTALTSTTGYAPNGSTTPAYDYNLGLSNWCLVSVIFCVAQADQYQVKFDGQSRMWAVDNSGNRFTQAYIRDTDLQSVVRGVVDSVEIVRTYNALGTTIGNAVLGLISDNVYDRIIGQLATGLGISVAEIPGYNIPYNLSNVGSLDINSPAFGITLQSQDLYYPGYFKYDAAGNATTTRVTMTKGWAMNLPAAFELMISQPMSEFTNNILSGSAAQGNIVGLPAPYRNCWGNVKFC
ncbi:hypothetical protein GCM10023206_26370 [Acinetobacter puyangensis]|uniref:Uncharacterized protein n=1 Tax=Acinetobacter puyangensis TaxID=1096779 RepID=A0A240E494_9GAMM|nr:hypothetical protein [Acinetobacter puyangensis]SNX43594.1 hypothetical protein SAMN05421731_101636 [Acinetobacter puyangensis]